MIHRFSSTQPLLVAALATAACTPTLGDFELTSHEATSRVASIADLRKRIADARPGDVIIVADGKYTTDADVVVNRAGTADKPILIAAQTVGGVEISGSNGITFERGAAFVTVRGFVFLNAAGTLRMPAGSRRCRYTRNTFELKGTGTYLTVSGDDHEVDHNLFQNKSTEGMMLSVQGAGNGMAQRTWVHHNHFHNFMKGTGNNFETVRVGLSGRSLSDAHSLFELNLFSDCNGENEIVSNKSGANTYRFNTIVDSHGSFTLRHGNNCLVYGNYLRNTEGIRFFGDGHKIFSNHLTGNSPAIQVGNGDGEVTDGAKLTSHDRPDRCEVSFNTLVDNDGNVAMSGRSGGLGATDLVVANNVIQGGGSAASFRGPVPGASFRGNIIWKASAGDLPSSGFRTVDPRLVGDSRGVFHLGAKSPAIGAAVGEVPSPAVDMDGQSRPAAWDVGADQRADGAAKARLLAPEDVGPSAPEELTARDLPLPEPEPEPEPVDPDAGAAP